MKRIVISLIISMTILSTVSAAEVPRESAPLCATAEQIILTENLVADVLSEVQKGMGYAEAKAKASRIIFNAVISNQTNGNGFGILSAIANNAIFQYRDMYLRPDFYAENVEKVRAIIAPVIEDYKSGKITYAEAEFNARNKIYQSINPNFDPGVEYIKDPIYRDIPPVDNSLFRIARKLLIE
ncbi:MAG: hypothetical protein E7394_05125 [Ruminococcaceae bacterium]|nr:hypothetical protein [Oscillospiraceae bacterium]